MSDEVIEQEVPEEPKPVDPVPVKDTPECVSGEVPQIVVKHESGVLMGIEAYNTGKKPEGVVTVPGDDKK